MKRLAYLLIILSIMVFACNISTTNIPPTTTMPTVPTLPPTNTVTPTVSETPVVIVAPEATTAPMPANLTCNELSLYLDPLLASGFKCETNPEVSEGMDVAPQYTKVTLEGYVLSGKFFTPYIMVLPIQRYTELLPDVVPGRVSALQALIGGGPVVEPLPFLPTFNAAQIFHAQYLNLPFASGGGIRYLTEYAQYFAPVNNYDLFYTYQGLTNDGKYWLTAILPINNPILPDTPDILPGGMSMEDFNNNYVSYITDMMNQLNAQISDSYSPSLTALDLLVASISIQP
jgi:hypothetical protein